MGWAPRSLEKHCIIRENTNYVPIIPQPVSDLLTCVQNVILIFAIFFLLCDSVAKCMTGKPLEISNFPTNETFGWQVSKCESVWWHGRIPGKLFCWLPQPVRHCVTVSYHYQIIITVGNVRYFLIVLQLDPYQIDTENRPCPHNPVWKSQFVGDSG